MVSSFMQRGQLRPGVPARVEGVVVDGLTNRPIPNVTVTVLQEADRLNSVSDPQGRFSFTVHHGTVRVFAARAGYSAIQPDGHQRPLPNGLLITTSSGQQIRGVTLRLMPTGSIAGRVYDARSKPVQYAKAQLWRFTYDDNGERSFRQVEGVRETEVNERGEFRLENIDPGEYYLRIDPPLLSERMPGESWLPVFHPGTNDRAKAVPVAVKGGSTVQLEDLTMQSVRGGTIRIRLINRTGESIQSTFTKFLSWRLRGTVAPAGVKVPLLIMGGPERAEIPVAPGAYEVIAGYSKASGPPFGLGNAIVEVGQRNVDVEIQVNKGFRISGQVLMEQPKGPPRPLAGVRCDLTGDGPTYASVTSGTDGSFVMDNLMPAIYRMSCSGIPADAFLTQIRQGERDVLKDGVQITNSESPGLNVTIAGAGGVVEGAVTDSKSQKVPAAFVALVPDPPSAGAGHLYRTSVADQNGVFNLRSVASGNYRLFAWREIDGGAYRNAEFMMKYDGQGTPVKVTSGAKLTVNTPIMD